MRTVTGLAAVLLVGQLAGCAQISALSKAAEFSGLDDALDAAEPTETVDMPDGGQGTYEGVALIGVQRGLQAVGLAGDVALRANFAPGGGTITGTIDDFVGAEVDPADILSSLDSNLVNMSEDAGQVNITSGIIAGNGFTADFDGDITHDNSDIAVNGTMDGGFFGANAELIEADASLGDGNMTATLDGDAANVAEFYLLAED